MDDQPTPLSGLPEDDTTRRLRAALPGEANSFQPSDRFAQILEAAEHQGSGAPATRGRFRWLAVAVVAMVALGIAVPLIGLRLRDRGDDTEPAAVPAQTVTQAASGSIPSADSGSLPTVIRGVPVYYFGPDAKLYREFHDLPTQQDRLTTAVAAVLNVAAYDPDFSSGWSGGQVNSARQVGDVIILDLSASAFSEFSTREQVLTAINQVVYTATAAIGDPTGARTVRILKDGDVNLPILGKPQADFPRGGITTLGLLWFNGPGSGQTVAAGTVEVTGQVQSSAAPARGLWTISSVKSGGQVAGGQLTLAKPADGWQTWLVRTRLPAGEYVVRIVLMADGPSGATPSVVATERTFIVK